MWYKQVYVILLLCTVILSVIVIVLMRHVETFEYLLTPNDDRQVIAALKTKLVPTFPELAYLVVLPNSGHTYTLNKSIIYLCIKDDKGTYYDDHMLTYALLHELAHAMNQANVGHTEEWNTLFNALLAKASEEKLLDLNVKLPPTYCLHKNY